MIYKGGMPWSRRPERNAPVTMQLPVVSAPTPETPELSPQDRAEVQRVLDLALGIGAAQLAAGVGAGDVTSTMGGVLEAYGVRRCQVDVTYDRITVSYRAWVGADPLTSMHRVRHRSLDYTRLQAVDGLIQRIADGNIDRSAANYELDQIVHAPHPYPRWVATVALAAVGAGMAVLLGGGLLVAIVAAGTTAAVDRIGRLLNRQGVLLFFQQVVGAALATTVTVLLTMVDVVEGSTTSLVAAASIVVLLSGMAVVGAVQDALTGYYLTGVARGVEIVLFSIGLLVGVTVALRIALALGVDVAITPDIVSPGPLSLPVRMAAGGVVAAGAALAS
ncbi:MAG: threonine/serine ThrE exporter family protein, partial [Nocardioidaceae bacterium]